jgi:serine/threonine protein kinase
MACISLGGNSGRWARDISCTRCWAADHLAVSAALPTRRRVKWCVSFLRSSAGLAHRLHLLPQRHHRQHTRCRVLTQTQPRVPVSTAQFWPRATRAVMHDIFCQVGLILASHLPPPTTQVALKRIPDVLSNSENAKRVLREVCILRRLEHPHVIALHDVFTTPSSTGE